MTQHVLKDNRQKLAVISIILFLVLINLILVMRLFDRSFQKYELTNTISRYNITNPGQFRQIIKLQSYLNEKEEPTEKGDKKDEGVIYDRVKFGPTGWKTLHVYAANYPVEPTEAQQEKIKIFLQLFAEFFPCHECGSHFMDMLNEKPIPAKNRQEFRQFVCDLHNKVNIRLSKPVFDCSKHEEVYGNPKGCGCSKAEGEKKEEKEEQKKGEKEDVKIINDEESPVSASGRFLTTSSSSLLSLPSKHLLKKEEEKQLMKVNLLQALDNESI